MDGAAADRNAELARFSTGQRLAAAGGYVGMAGGALGLAGLLTSALEYQPTGDILAYGGSGLWALGFCLEAGGLGLQHSAAGRLGLDPGRGLFAGGTTLGVLGLASAGVSLYTAKSNVFSDSDSDTRLKVQLSLMAGSIVFMTVGRILYAFDERRLARAFFGQGTF